MLQALAILGEFREALLAAVHGLLLAGRFLAPGLFFLGDFLFGPFQEHAGFGGGGRLPRERGRGCGSLGGGLREQKGRQAG
jgi:hypothetical protein